MNTRKHFRQESSPVSLTLDGCSTSSNAHASFVSETPNKSSVFDINHCVQSIVHTEPDADEMGEHKDSRKKPRTDFMEEVNVEMEASPQLSHASAMDKDRQEEYCAERMPQPEAGPSGISVFSNANAPEVEQQKSASRSQNALTRRMSQVSLEKKRRKKKSLGLRPHKKQAARKQQVPSPLPYGQQSVEVNKGIIKEMRDILGTQEESERFSTRIGKWHKEVEEIRKENSGSLSTVILGGRHELKVGGVPEVPPAYPEEYCRLSRIWICDSCFWYFKAASTFQRHYERCPFFVHPPGNEVYRDTKRNLAVFHVDGNYVKDYCSRLSRFAMLFLKEKVVFVDAHNFNFYLLVEWSGERAYKPVGYFSKQKHDTLGNNLACFVVFPCYQKRGFGRFIIHFSYYLTRLERGSAGPERPFSSKGEKAYTSYWTSIIYPIIKENLSNKRERIPFCDIVRATGILQVDIEFCLSRHFTLSSQGKDKVMQVDRTELERIDAREEERQKRYIPLLDGSFDLCIFREAEKVRNQAYLNGVKRPPRSDEFLLIKLEEAAE